MLSFLDSVFEDPRENLRFDEELLEAGNGILRLWESATECIVLGKSGKMDRDVHLESCHGSGIPILRRCSGGGAVMLGPGCLNFSLVLPLALNPSLRDVRCSLMWIGCRMVKALGVPNVGNAGDSDLAFFGRKVSGSAQRRTQTAILHHGTLLYNFDITRPEQFLSFPDRQPEYRAGRSHRDFLGNLPLTATDMRARLQAAWC